MRNVRWQEPAAFRRASEPARPWQVGLVVSACVAALVLLLRAVVHAPDLPPWPLMFLIAAAGGCGIGLFLPWFTSLLPSEVIVSPKGINRNAFRGASLRIQFWSWDRIGRCAVQRLEMGGRSFRALVIYDAADSVVGRIGLSGRAPLDDLESCFAAQRKPLDRGLESPPIIIADHRRQTRAAGVVSPFR